jgi:hypothetical protein
MNKLEEHWNEYSQLKEMMEDAGWVYGKYDDQMWHRFQTGKENTMSMESAELLFRNQESLIESAKQEAITKYLKDNHIVKKPIIFPISEKRKSEIRAEESAKQSLIEEAIESVEELPR